MNETDRETFASALFGHFPEAAIKDGDLCWMELRMFDLPTADRAMQRHRLELGARAYRPSPKRLAELARQIERGGKPAAFDQSTYDAYANAFKREARDNAEIVETVIGAMTDTELATAQAEVVADLEQQGNAFMASRMKRADPLKSPALANLITLHCRPELATRGKVASHA